MSSRPCGIFDSGVGGLSVLRHLRAQLPAENFLYFADQANVPYGGKSMAEVRRFAVGITDFLLDQGAKLIVVACNSASAAALEHLRRSYPGVPFVGMEPAVKPAVAQTHSGKIGVLATEVTLRGDLLARSTERFAGEVEVYEEALPGVIEPIEAGITDGQAMQRILGSVIEPLLSSGVDTLVLGCTHYPFLLPLIEKIVGKRAVIIDPSPAVARQAERLLAEQQLQNLSATPGSVDYYTSGSPQKLDASIKALSGETSASQQVSWGSDNRLRLP